MGIKKSTEHEALYGNQGNKYFGNWETDPEFFNYLNSKFNFNLDVCATLKNAKCKKFITKEKNGLKIKWKGRIYCNPPYIEAKEWLEKCWKELKKGNIGLGVVLLNVRTDTKWFHEYSLKADSIIFLKGRLKFGKYGKFSPGPLASALFIFGWKKGVFLLDWKNSKLKRIGN